jgi:hypothetical protein
VHAGLRERGKTLIGSQPQAIRREERERGRFSGIYKVGSEAFPLLWPCTLTYCLLLHCFKAFINTQRDRERERERERERDKHTLTHTHTQREGERARAQIRSVYLAYNSFKFNLKNISQIEKFIYWLPTRFAIIPE